MNEEQIKHKFGNTVLVESTCRPSVESTCVPSVEGFIPKTVIYTKYMESLKSIKALLDNNKINYLILNGTSSMIHNTLMKFKDSSQHNVLIMTSCNAGIDIQFATDLILYHNGNELESQIIGRLQRIGRTTSARIHLLSYNTER